MTLAIRDLKGGCWPTPLQQLLVRASLLEGESAARAWSEWHAQDGLERLDLGSYRMLPLAYRNLSKQGVVHPAMGTLKGIYRRGWVENQTLFRVFRGILPKLQDAGIEMMLLKGIALILGHYRDYGVRPMQDVDVLVHQKDAFKAFGIFESEGWTRTKFVGVRFTERELNYRQALGFRAPANDAEIDLHWHALYVAPSSRTDAFFWDGAAPMTFDGIAMIGPNPTDHLLITCAHGNAWNEVPPIRWVADAITIMRTSDIDWQRLLHLARELRLALPLRDAFRYLAKEFGAAVPHDVLAALDTLPSDRTDRLQYARSQEVKLQTPRDTLLAVYGEYRRTAYGQSRVARAFGFLKYLQFYWRLDKFWKVAPYAAHWLWYRTRLFFSNAS